MKTITIARRYRPQPARASRLRPERMQSTIQTEPPSH
jgi:hypothetical protein